MYKGTCRTDWSNGWSKYRYNFYNEEKDFIFIKFISFEIDLSTGAIIGIVFGEIT